MESAAKTIIYAGGFELPDKNAAAQRVLANAKAYRDLGYKVVLLDVDRKSKLPVLETKSTCFGFERFSVDYSNKRLISIENFKKVFGCCDGVCAVIAYNYPALALAKLLSFCKSHSVKLIADATEWYGVQGSNIVRKTIKGLDSYLRMNVIHTKVDGMIAISRYLEDYYKDKLKTVCVPPLVDSLEEKWNVEKWKECGDIKIVYAGSPGKNKDKLNKIIEALVKLGDEDVCFSVIGLTKDKYLEYYPTHRELLEGTNVKIEFCGHVAHTEAIKAVKESDFSMFCRDVNRVTSAGFPTKFSEAISCGTPVITNKTSNLDEYLKEGINGYWLDVDIEGALKKIIKKEKSDAKIKRDEIDDKTFDYRRYISLLNDVIK